MKTITALVKKAEKSARFKILRLKGTFSLLYELALYYKTELKNSFTMELILILKSKKDKHCFLIKQRQK